MDPHDDFADQDWLDDDWERRLLNGTVAGAMAVGLSKNEEWVKRCWAERRQHRREALSRRAAAEDERRRRLEAVPRPVSAEAQAFIDALAAELEG